MSSETKVFIEGYRYQLLGILVRDLFSPSQVKQLDLNKEAALKMEPKGDQNVSIPLGIFVHAVLIGDNGALLKVDEVQDIEITDERLKGAYFLGSNSRTRSKFRDVTG